MLPRTIDTIGDAYEIIRHYNLHMADFAGATAEGFAAYLFVPGTKIWSAWHLAGCLSEYKAEFTSHASRGEDFDFQLKSEMRDLCEAMGAHDELRWRLALIAAAVFESADDALRALHGVKDRNLVVQAWR